MKKILYLGGFELPDKNAAAQRVIANAKLLRDLRYEVAFMGVSKDIDNAPAQVYGFDSKPVKYPTTLSQWIHQILTFIDFEFIKSYKPDYVILYNFPSIASLRILKKCHKLGIKVIHDLTEWEEACGWTPREIIHRIDISLRMRYCMKKMDGVIAISRYLFDYYNKYTKCILVPPTVDLENTKFDRDRDLEKNTPGIRLVYAGSSGLSKDRLDIIVNSVQHFPKIHLDVIGLNKEQYSKIYKISVPEMENVIFHRRISHQEAIKAVCNADFQMLIREDTLKNRAGFPTKFVESMSCCTPIIATKTSNICDYLEDGKNGFVVSEENTLDSILSRISELSYKDITMMKQACKNFTGFDYRNYKCEFLKLFD